MFEGTPTKIKRLKNEAGEGAGLEIEWSSGEVVTLSAKTLREGCPCATCSEKKGNDTHANPLGSPRVGRALLQIVESTAEDDFNLKRIWTIGNYAFGILWGDGHDSGIYSHAVLRELSDRK